MSRRAEIPCFLADTWWFALTSRLDDDRFRRLVAQRASQGFTAIAILILLVGWMNGSSLMVAAALGRRHGIAVRLSLGASRARLLRQFMSAAGLGTA